MPVNLKISAVFVTSRRLRRFIWHFCKSAPHYLGSAALCWYNGAGSAADKPVLKTHLLVNFNLGFLNFLNLLFVLIISKLQLTEQHIAFFCEWKVSELCLASDAKLLLGSVIFKCTYCDYLLRFCFSRIFKRSVF